MVEARAKLRTTQWCDNSAYHWTTVTTTLTTRCLMTGKFTCCWWCPRPEAWTGSWSPWRRPAWAGCRWWRRPRWTWKSGKWTQQCVCWFQHKRPKSHWLVQKSDARLVSNERKEQTLWPFSELVGNSNITVFSSTILSIIPLEQESPLHFLIETGLAALPKQCINVTLALVDGQQVTYVPSLTIYATISYFKEPTSLVNQKVRLHLESV